MPTERDIEIDYNVDIIHVKAVMIPSMYPAELSSTHQGMNWLLCAFTLKKNHTESDSGRDHTVRSQCVLFHGLATNGTINGATNGTDNER